MKKACVCLSISFVAVTAFAQGTVTFRNTPTTLISSGPVGQEAVVAGPAGSYYFGLLIAPAGTTDPNQFAFTHTYATNGLEVGFAPGRLFGGWSVQVPGRLPGMNMSFLVAGWSSTLGLDGNQGWLSGTFGAPGYFGLSSIGTGAAGGPSGGVPAPALPLFGPVGEIYINTGFNLDPVPEPPNASIAALGVLTPILYRTRLPTRPNPRSALDAGFVSCLHSGSSLARASESER
jgi:hypothetical protein